MKVIKFGAYLIAGFREDVPTVCCGGPRRNNYKATVFCAEPATTTCSDPSTSYTRDPHIQWSEFLYSTTDEAEIFPRVIYTAGRVSTK